MRTIFFLLILCLSGSQVHAERKTIIGQTAWINVEGIPFSYLARIDTGAKSSSIHATHIQISDKSPEYSQNIGKPIVFQTMNGEGKAQSVTAVISGVSAIRNSQGIEYRYVIKLPLSYKNVTKNVEVNLRNRSQMNYKFLIGRNFLSEDFLVDVDIRADQREVSKQLHPEN